MRLLDTDTQGLMPQTTPRAARVLVVEDNEVVREGLAVVLGRAGYEVGLAANGEEALGLLRAGPAFDLILLEMDGWCFEERPAREGCQDFLQKPIDSGPLLGEVRRCLGQG
jgi:DNA-binding NtrC family response regulator